MNVTRLHHFDTSVQVSRPFIDSLESIKDLPFSITVGPLNFFLSIDESRMRYGLKFSFVFVQF